MRHRLRRFISLPARDGWLLAKAWATVVTVRIGLWILPYPWVHRIQTWFARRPIDRLQKRRAAAERVAWTVAVASHYFPRARHCLTEGIATHILLSRRGYPAQLRIGVAKENARGLEAHAWVESEGRVFIGDTELHKYTELPLGSDLTERGEAPGDE